jgi:hypothetical protein
LDDYTVKALSPDTWDAFARLAERHNGVFGGCWCTWFQTMSAEKERTCEANRSLKQRLVDEGRAHAALVRPAARLPDHLHLRGKEVREEGTDIGRAPGALDLIAEAGGGVVEGYPHDNDGKKMSVLYNGTRSLFQQSGFSYVRPKGTRNCVMRKEVS